MQLVSLDSVPRHPTSSSSIGIVPWPKYAPVRAMEPALWMDKFKSEPALKIFISGADGSI